MSAELRERRHALQERVTGLVPPLPESPDALFKEIRQHLWQAADQGALRTPPQGIMRLLKRTSEGQPRGQVAITGGEKNEKRTRDRAHFERDDGAWFDFAITVAYEPGVPLVLLGYNFEIRFPDLQSPLFVRFDVNLPGHENEALGIRSHLHPGSDDLQVPAPFMSPLEVLDDVVYGLRLREGRKPRATRGASA
ncbi:hypothetical protein [Polyangium jinanense]|uniref:Uncharacterized protein n=1 Tax=Polyangium jinanense TaxID=2829994 RepID=A0A9X3X0M1_9BACT|nr:hypothetical protein [Polyangium jinanense]MDC3954132.1 hypothetical protein [Polyangium jinanense]MDC3981912.1 hypothetical protein [Polyangium jinanense]